MNEIEPNNIKMHKIINCVSLAVRESVTMNPPVEIAVKDSAIDSNRFIPEIYKRIIPKRV